MREQTKNNAQYLVGMKVLKGLSLRLGWSEAQFKAACAELVRRLSPTLAEM